MTVVDEVLQRGQTNAQEVREDRAKLEPQLKKAEKFMEDNAIIAQVMKSIRRAT